MSDNVLEIYTKGAFILLVCRLRVPFIFSVTHLNVIQALRLSLLLSTAIQRVHADVAVLPRRHGQRLSCSVRVGDEVAQLLLGNIHALVDSGIAHLHHGTQEVEVPRSIRSSTKQDEKDEHERIAQNWDE